MSGASRPIRIACFTLPWQAGPSGAKSWPLPSPPAISTSGASRPVDRRDGRADVGALRVVDPRDAPQVAHALGAVRQAAEALQHAGHRRAREAADAADGERGERVRGVVAPRQRERGERQDRLGALGEPVLAGLPQQPEVRVGAAQAEADAALSRARHAHDDPVVEVDDGGRRALEDARLGRGVLGEVAVTVEVVRAHVQHRGRLRLQRPGGLELVRGELEHVHRRRRTVEQVERGLAEVAADAHLEPGGLRERADQRGHRALAVRAGDADHAAAGFAREQLDVADEVEPLRRRLAQEGLGERDAGRHDDLVGALEHRRVEAAERGRRLRHEPAQLREAGRVRARVGDDEPVAARGQVPGRRHAGAAEAHDHAARCADGLLHQRSFSVASPMRTSMNEMIQKRTMTFGSAQPFSS